MATSTLAVALEMLPASGGLVAVVAAPRAGVTFSTTVLPTGIPLVANTTVAGLGVAAGRITSPAPLGTAGAATPATLVIASDGNPARFSVPAVRTSTLLRPRPPAPPLTKSPVSPLAPPLTFKVPL